MSNIVLNTVLIVPILFLAWYLVKLLTSVKPQCMRGENKPECVEGLGGIGDMMAPFVLSAASSVMLVLIVILISVNNKN